MIESDTQKNTGIDQKESKTFTWRDEHGIPHDYPIERVKEIILGEVGERQKTAENEKHPDIHGISKREVLPTWRVKEELVKARTVSVDKKQ